ncbi:MAG: UDP-N-acetylglucosamine 2-epimerase (non-hydrolyzing) [Gammaproteobacteria bacterium]
MTRKTVLLCMGTRPEIIKLAPLFHALRAQPEINVLVLHSGQHDELAEEMYRFFDMSPEYRFQFDRQRQSLGHLFALMMDQMDELFSNIRPDAVIVQGDTSTALAGALTGFYYRCQIGHVEAGLRSFDEYEPFPEEKTRELISRLAHWHFAPTQMAVENLAHENISPAKIYHVGNTVVDAVNWARRHADISTLQGSADLRMALDWIGQDQDNKRLVLVTTHRRESWDGDISNIAQAIHDAALRYPDLYFIWPVHPNPLITDVVHEIMHGLDNGNEKRVCLTKPISYPILIQLLQHAWVVLTDSGGIQEEALTLQVPVMVLRNKTERPEVTDAHGGILIGTQRDRIINCIQILHDDPDYHTSFKCVDNPFGDGHSAERISEIIVNSLIDSQAVTKQLPN